MVVDAHVRFSRPGIIVFAPDLLPYSQTFIRAHVESLARFRPVLTGFRKIKDLDLGQLRTATIARTRVRRWMLYFLGRSPELDRLISQEDAKLVHCHFAEAGGLMAAYCRRRGIPLIITIHGSDILRRRSRSLPSWLRARLFSFARQSAALFLPVSDWLLDQAKRLGIPPEKCVRHYLGIPLEPRRRVHRSDGPPTILMVGRLIEKKGIAYLLEAAIELTRRNCSYHLRIVGDGPLVEAAIGIAEQNRLPVTFAGALSPDQVLAEMDSADIFCVPSTQAPDGDNEGLGLVFLEAQSRSLPVVSFHQGPVPEAVANGRTGILVADKHAGALADALALLLENPTRRRSMGEAGRCFVEEKFDILQQTPKLEDLYEQVLAAAEDQSLRLCSQCH